MTKVGWGVQPWGTSPWGGSVVQDQPPLPIGDFDRWERVYRERRREHEPETIRNVVFAVVGVSAKLRVGAPICFGGEGRAARLRRSLRMRCGVGAVAIETGTGTWARAEASRSACDCGAVEAGVSVRCEMEQGMRSESDVGLTKVRAIRNPTDEEFLMMLAEML